MCSPADQAVFASYDNYARHMGTCADMCVREFLASPKTAGRQCAMAEQTCPSLGEYSPQCKQCIVDEITCQMASCRSACLSARYADECRACTDANCRSAFASCSGLRGAELSSSSSSGDSQAGGGGGGFSTAAVAGGILASFVALAVALVARQRFRERGATREMALAFERRLFPPVDRLDVQVQRVVGHGGGAGVASQA